MKTPTQKTWIVIADGAQARILLNTSRMDGVQQIPNGSFHASHAASHELGTERPPRVQESFGGARHAIEPRSDPHEQQKELFLSGISEFLRHAHHNKEFENLVIVAPASALGTLRKTLDPLVRKKVIAEFAHDYSHQDNQTVYEHIKASLPL